MNKNNFHSAVSVSSAGSENQGMLRQMFTEVGTYHANLVAIRRVKKQHILLTKSDFKELKVVQICCGHIYIQNDFYKFNKYLIFYIQSTM